jgi:hypothetical protein
MTNFFFNASVVMLHIALFGMLVVIGLAVYTALKVKNDMMRNVKGFYERPMRGVKNLMVTGKGIVRQEAVRIGEIKAHGQKTVSCVQETVTEFRDAAQSLTSEEVHTMVETLRGAARVASAAADFARSAARQGASS